jgi:hypothetical protein
MVHPQRETAEDQFTIVPAVIADAARRYQRIREIEKEHLAAMARQNLLIEWSTEVRAVVLEARGRIQDARAAREQFRRQVREFVVTLKAARDSLPAVLRHTRSMLRLLEQSGAIEPGDDWFKTEVIEWAIEDYETAA